MGSFRETFLRTMSAVRGRDEKFPGVSEYLHDFPWQMPQASLDFPKATALVPTVYALVSRIANDLAAVPPTFWLGRGEDRQRIERKPGNIVDLYASANPVQTGYEMENERQQSLDINGNAYLYLETFGRSGPPGEIWTLPGHLVRPLPGPRRTIKAYEYGFPGRGVMLAPEKVIHFRYSNPNWDPLEPAPVGLSPLSAGQKAYETRYNMGRWHDAVYRKGGAVAHIFSIDSDARISEQKIKEWQASIERRGAGVENVGKPFIMQGMKIERSGLTVAEMQFMEAAALTDEDLCMIYGTNSFILGRDKGGGLREGATEGMMLQHVEGCVLPRIRLRDAVLTETLCKRFGDDIVCETDVSGILAIQNVRLKQAETILTLVGKVMTPNEGRERLDLPKDPSPEADKLTFAPDPLELEKAKAEGAKAAGGDSGPTAKPGAKPPARGRSANRRTALSRGSRKARASADLARYERRVEAGMREVFTLQEGAVLAGLRQMARAQGIEMTRTRLDFDAEILELPFDEDARSLLSRLFAELVRERGEAAAAEIGRELILEVTAGRIAQFIADKVKLLVTGTSETTKKALQASLAEAAARQESFAEVAARVREVFDGRRANALTIARTETAGAYNFAAWQAWTQSGEDLEKEWLSADDPVVRPIHVLLDGQIVPMAEPFSVVLEDGSTARAMYPLGFGIPELDINCRCTIAAKRRKTSGMSRYFAAPSLNGHSKNGNRLAGLFAESR